MPAKTPKSRRQDGPPENPGKGGEPHQTADTTGSTLTTNQGTPVSDNQNTLRAGVRGPALLEDFIFREKITHFDHERIPERIVHARGSGAHGFFQAYESQAGLTRAAFLQDPKKKTPVFARFSTVAGGSGSVDLPRDVRGFSVKFYTEEGNYDLVANNIPVFFIQDAMKFPDLVHAVKMEPDRGYPQNASAHDTFWDFVTLNPESMHMLMWVMSDRAIPRSLRMIEGFGVHTFRLITAGGKSTFVKFHWRPKLGLQSVMWDEAVKINGADQDFHRRDLFESIKRGDFPEWELCFQSFDERFAEKFEFDVLDPTKLIPEEVVPVTPVGRMVLNRNPDNFFAEVEQIAFHPGHVVPGIDFSNDPLLQGRLFSYLDTQLKRLGSANFHEIPINRPKTHAANYQRDGQGRQDVPTGRVAYEPNSLDPSGPRENPRAGFRSFPQNDEGSKLRQRSPSFDDHYSQARMFWRSMTESEQGHIVNAFGFELGKVETLAIRTRMLGHLHLIEPQLGKAVEGVLGMEGTADRIKPVRAPIDLDPSPSLSIQKKAVSTLKGRKVGVLLGNGCDVNLLTEIKAAAKRAGAIVEVVARKVGGVASGGKTIKADHALAAAPSCFFDAVAVVSGDEGIDELVGDADAAAWLRDAFGHLKVIAHTEEAEPLLAKAGIKPDDGVTPLAGKRGAAAFINAAKKLRLWQRERPGVTPGPG
jgi:catalase